MDGKERYAKVGAKTGEDEATKEEEEEEAEEAKEAKEKAEAEVTVLGGQEKQVVEAAVDKEEAEVEVVVLGEKVVGKDETEMRVEKNTEEAILLVKVSMQERTRKKKGAKLRRK
jgi:hypothetical protein